MPARLVPIEQECDAGEAAQQKFRLALRESRSHQRQHPRMAGLMHLQRIEKSFHYDHLVAARLDRPIEVEQHLRFSETGGKTVLGFWPVDRAPRIGNQPALLVANRDHATAGQEARAKIHPHAKPLCRGRRDAALREIRMPGVNPLQGKTQRAIGLGSGSFFHRDWRQRHGIRWGHATAKPVLQPDTGLAQRTAFHDSYQVDHMTANAAVAGGDTRGGVAGPHLPRQIHGKALVTLARSMGGEWTGAAPSVRPHRPQLHAIARQHAIDRDALFDTPEIRLWWWHES